MTQVPTLHPDRDPISDEQLRELAALSVSGELEQSYVDFLHRSNGCTAEECNFVIPDGGGSLVRRFYSSHEPADSLRPAAIARTVQHRGWQTQPQTILLIGDDPFGNYLCLSTEPDSFGAIYFSDSEKGDTEREPRQTISDFGPQLTRIADSFGDLVSNKLMDDAEWDTYVPPGGWATPVESAPEPKAPSPQVETPQPALVGDASAVQVYAVGSPIGFQYPLMKNVDKEPLQPNNGVAALAAWKPVEIRFKDEVGELTSDLPFGGGKLLVFSPIALDSLGELFAPYGEFLPVTSKYGPLHFFRCLNVVDALAGDAETFSKGELCFIRSHVFDADKVPRDGVFTVPQQSMTADLFFTRPIVQAVIDSGLRHVPFEFLWDAETGKQRNY